MSHPLPLLDALASVPDPRMDRTLWHPLPEVLFIALCAALCGADGFTQIEAWGRAKEAWLRQRLTLPHGIPSHDTFNRVFSCLDPEAFTTAFLRWVASLYSPTQGQLIALDGKTLRHSFTQANRKDALHVVSAWAVKNRLVLGQVKVDQKSNEITALPELLALLDITGCLVTIDAMGCQKEIARQIVAQGGDYVLALKGNQGSLHADVELFLEDALTRNFQEVEHHPHRTFDAEHGRQETRRYWLTPEVAWLRERHGEQTWAKLTSLGMVESRRRNGGPGTPVTVERRYYLCSLAADTPGSAAQFAAAVRGHWGIENSVHWVLDVAFREDDCRVRKDHAPTNLATLRHWALNHLRQDRMASGGIQTKRLRAGWDERYLEKLLTI
jgi:predicted transposase YbfD/YdcC